MTATWTQKYNKAFGNHLRDLRTTKKLSQVQLSKISGVSLGHISRIERGVRSPSLTTIADLAFAMKLHPKVLLEYKVEEYH